MSLLGSAQLIGFLGASVLITASPGPDNLMVLSIGASRGRAAGMAFGFGCACGCLSHTLLAALGVSALIRASPLAFAALQALGGLYLVYLGWGAIRSRAPTGGTAPAPAMRGATARLFGRGLIANAINPKVVMFFLAFLPQFVDPARGDLPWQIAALGVSFTLQAALLFGLLGYFSGVIGQSLRRHANAGLWLDRLAGAVFLGMGARLLLGR